MSKSMQGPIRYDLGGADIKPDRRYINNGPDQYGTQFLLSHSLTADQVKALRAFKIDYSEDAPDDNAFVTVDAEHISKVEALLQEWGFQQ